MHRFFETTASPALSIPIGTFGFVQQLFDWTTPFLQWLILICTFIIVGHSALKILFGKKKSK
jgi:hypothetical protein